METTQNEFQAEMNQELDAENRAQVATLAETWGEINDLMDTILVQAKELEKACEELKANAFNIFPKF